MEHDDSHERQAFEQWFYQTRGYAELTREDDGTYEDINTYWAWQSWKAAKADNLPWQQPPKTLPTSEPLTH